MARRRIRHSTATYGRLLRAGRCFHRWGLTRCELRVGHRGPHRSARHWRTHRREARF